jgi:Anti-sigma factor NepR
LFQQNGTFFCRVGSSLATAANLSGDHAAQFSDEINMNNKNGDRGKVNGDSFIPRSRSGSDPIGAALKRLHDDVVAEPIPDDFMRLLSQIDEKLEERRS